MNVELAPLRPDNLAPLAEVAIREADPEDVMPLEPGPPGWNAARVQALDRFHRDRLDGLDGPHRTQMFAVLVDGATAGMIRMTATDEQGVLETGIWLGRSFRGKGIGGAALLALLARAAASGAHTVVAQTSPTNAAAQGILRRHGATLTTSDGSVSARVPVAVATARANRANWDARAAVHGQDGYYDADGLIAGRDSLTPMERAGLGAAMDDVRGRDVLHVQCHLGFDAISLTRRGARVVGVDFSPVALEKARRLAVQRGAEVEFVEADVTDLPAPLHGRFDLAYATIGVLCWIADVGAWMRSVASTLRPGGRLLLVDGHPLAHMVASVEPPVLDFPYAFDGPHFFHDPGTYADPDARVASPLNVQYAHSLGEIVTAAVDAGLRVVRLDEHLESPVDTHTPGDADDDGAYRLRIGGGTLPVFFTLVAEVP